MSATINPITATDDVVYDDDAASAVTDNVAASIAVTAAIAADEDVDDVLCLIVHLFLLCLVIWILLRRFVCLVNSQPGSQ